tara:strand:+ start:104 stop:253 length:150 start_codon:yes stop_codon:yes gene_type:complete
MTITRHVQLLKKRYYPLSHLERDLLKINNFKIFVSVQGNVLITIINYAI